MMETCFFNILKNSDAFGRLNPDDSPVTPPSAICATRIYPLVLPKDPVFPAITYSFVGGSSQATNDTLGTQRQRVEVNCWGNTYLDAITLRYAVIMTLSQYKDQGVFISFLQSTNLFDPDLLEYRAMAEFYITSNLGNS
jgi:hypothetical protein